MLTACGTAPLASHACRKSTAAWQSPKGAADSAHLQRFLHNVLCVYETLLPLWRLPPMSWLREWVRMLRFSGWNLNTR